MSNFNLPLRDLNLTTKIWACTENSSLKQAILTMQKQQIGCLIVSNENKDVLGIFTERDILLKVVGKDLNLEQEKIKDYMSPHPTSMNIDDSVIKALQAMEFGQFRHMVVLDDQLNLKSVVSMKDIAKCLLHTIENKSL